MSDVNDSKAELDNTIEKMGAEVDRLNKKLAKLSGVEGQNRALAEQNSHLENEIKILKSDFIELKNIAGNISSQLDENIYTIKDILDS
tara:strand:+ start:80 stop:343 length:264 start_codon:yes stop_codon:yes gene_type:complete